MENTREALTENPQYHTIHEIAQRLDLTLSQLRYWESLFRDKFGSHREGYTEDEVAIFQKLKVLLLEEKFTPEGARQKIFTLQIEDDPTVFVKESLLKLRSFLVELRDSL